MTIKILSNLVLNLVKEYRSIYSRVSKSQQARFRGHGAGNTCLFVSDVEPSSETEKLQKSPENETQYATASIHKPGSQAKVKIAVAVSEVVKLKPRH